MLQHDNNITSNCEQRVNKYRFGKNIFAQNQMLNKNHVFEHFEGEARVEAALQFSPPSKKAVLLREGPVILSEAKDPVRVSAMFTGFFVASLLRMTKIEGLAE